MDRIVNVNAGNTPTSTSPRIFATNDGEKFPIIVNIGSRLRDVVERFNLDLAFDSPMPGKTLKVETFTADWAIREIMSFGGEVSLESPHELRKALQDRAARALNAYQGSV